jgi:hypothetical protein
VRRTGDGGERSSATAIGLERLGARIGGKERSGVERWRRAHFIGPGGGGEEARRPAVVEY